MWHAGIEPAWLSRSVLIATPCHSFIITEARRKNAVSQVSHLWHNTIIRDSVFSSPLIYQSISPQIVLIHRSFIAHYFFWVWRQSTRPLLTTHFSFCVCRLLQIYREYSLHHRLAYLFLAHRNSAPLINADVIVSALMQYNCRTIHRTYVPILVFPNAAVHTADAEQCWQKFRLPMH